jgi:hypothetical protein
MFEVADLTIWELYYTTIPIPHRYVEKFTQKIQWFDSFFDIFWCIFTSKAACFGLTPQNTIKFEEVLKNLANSIVLLLRDCCT